MSGLGVADKRISSECTAFARRDLRDDKDEMFREHADEWDGEFDLLITLGSICLNSVQDVLMVLMEAVSHHSTMLHSWATETIT
jgi:hypothetical protein